MTVYELVAQMISKIMQRFSDSLVLLDVDFDDDTIIRIAAVWEIERNATVKK